MADHVTETTTGTVQIVGEETLTGHMMEDAAGTVTGTHAATVKAYNFFIFVCLVTVAVMVHLYELIIVFWLRTSPVKSVGR